MFAGSTLSFFSLRGGGAGDRRLVLTPVSPLSSCMSTLYTFGDNMTAYEPESVHFFLGL